MSMHIPTVLPESMLFAHVSGIKGNFSQGIRYGLAEGPGMGT